MIVSRNLNLEIKRLGTRNRKTNKNMREVQTMAKTYIINYTTPAGKYKNSFAEAEQVGAVLRECATKVIHMYGGHFQTDSDSYLSLRTDLYNPNEIYHAFSSTDFQGRAYTNPGKKVDISFTSDKKIIFYFGVDPLIKENANDEIIMDIKSKLVEYGIITEETTVFSSDEEYSNAKFR